MYVHIDSFSRSTRLQFQTLCFTQIYPFSDFWYMHFEAVRDILEIRRSLLVEDIFERIPSYFHTCVEIHILLFIVNIIPFILYLMLYFFLPLFLFIKRNLIFTISLYSLLVLSFQLLKLVSFCYLFAVSFLQFLLFPFYPHCLHYLSQLIGIVFFFLRRFTFYFLQIFFVSIFFSIFISTFEAFFFFWNTILSLSRYYRRNFSGIPFRTNSIIELLLLVDRNISKFLFHHGRVFQDDIAPKQGW